MTSPSFPRVACAVLAAAGVIAPGSVAAQGGGPASAEEPITVAVREIEPFAIDTDGVWSGYSIDMWEQAAENAGIEFEYLPVDTVGDQLEVVGSGVADAALGAVSITEERERQVDFTQPMYDSGIGILVSDTAGDGGLFPILRPLFTRTLMFLIAAFLVLIVVVGHVVWIVERRRNDEDFPRDYRRGVVEGMWWAVVTMTTVGYGDKVARTKAGRVVAAVWMLVGLVLVAQFTAVVTSSLTVDRIQGDVSSIADLYGKPVATVADTTSAAYLADIDLAAVEVSDIEDATQLLLDAEVDAVVYDEPVLAHVARTTARDRSRLLPVLYQPQGIGMVFAEGSDLVEPVNHELLALREDGTAATLDDRYFG